MCVPYCLSWAFEMSWICVNPTSWSSRERSAQRKSQITRKFWYFLQVREFSCFPAFSTFGLFVFSPFLLKEVVAVHDLVQILHFFWYLTFNNVIEHLEIKWKAVVDRKNFARKSIDQISHFIWFSDEIKGLFVCLNICIGWSDNSGLYFKICLKHPIPSMCNTTFLKSQDY